MHYILAEGIIVVSPFATELLKLPNEIITADYIRYIEDLQSIAVRYNGETS